MDVATEVANGSEGTEDTKADDVMSKKPNNPLMQTWPVDAYHAIKGELGCGHLRMWSDWGSCWIYEWSVCGITRKMVFTGSMMGAWIGAGSTPSEKARRHAVVLKQEVLREFRMAQGEKV